jgi:Na+/melibiose symporter-like transporter
VGPGVGALAVKLAGGPRAAFVIDAATFGLSLLSLTLLREPPRETTAPEDRLGMVHEIAEGLAEVRRRPWVAAVLVMSAVSLMVVVAPETVLLPIIGRRVFGSDTVFITSLALVSAGGLVGAVVALRWRPKYPGLVGMLGLLPFAAVPLVLAYPIAPWMFYVAYFVAGVGLEPLTVYWQTALQRDIPEETIARVSSIDWMSSLALLPLGMALTGPAVAAFGERQVLWVAAILNVVTALTVLFVPGVRELRSVSPKRDAVRSRG